MTALPPTTGVGQATVAGLTANPTGDVGQIVIGTSQSGQGGQTAGAITGK